MMYYIIIDYVLVTEANIDIDLQSLKVYVIIVLIYPY